MKFPGTPSRRLLACASLALCFSCGAEEIWLRYGESNPLCQAQLALLKNDSSGQPPVCDVGLSPTLPAGATAMTGEELNPEKYAWHLHAIEMRLKHQFKSKPESDFEAWRLTLKKRLKVPAIKPHLLRFEVSVDPSTPAATVFGYYVGEAPCRRDDYAVWSNPTGFELFLLEEKKRVVEWLTTGYLISFKGDTYIFSSQVAEYRQFVWRAAINRISRLPTFTTEGWSRFEGTELNLVCDVASVLPSAKPSPLAFRRYR
jgi:hypothetical protein